MITLKRLFICLVLALVGNNLSAQTEKEIAEKYREALGQMANDSAGQTFTGKGDFTMRGLSLPTLFYWRFPKNMRFEMSLGKMTFVMVANDSVRWEYNPMTKKSKTSPIAPDSQDEDNTFDFVHRDLLNYKKLNYKLKLVGKTKLDSLEVFELKLIKGNKEATTLFLSTHHYLIHKVVDGKGARFFANYYFYDQYRFPRFVRDETRSDDLILEFHEIVFKKPISDSLFVIPEPDVEPANKNTPKGSKVVKNGRKSILERGDDFYNRKEYDSAIRYFTLSLKNDGDSFRAFNSRGLARLEKQQYYDAMVDFNRASEIIPDSWAARNNIGLAKFYLGDYENAIKDFNQALQFDPEAENALSNRGLSYFNLGEYEKSAADFSELVRRSPKNGEWIFKLGMAQAQLKKYEEALVSYRKALALKFVNASVMNYKGVSHHYLKQYDSAIVNFRSAVEQDPENLTYVENLGRAFYDAEMFEEAKKYFELYLKRKKDDADIYNFIGLCNYQEEDFKGAIRDFSKAIELNNEGAVYYDNRASAKEEIEDYDGAIADYGESIRIYPNDPSVFYRRGMLKIYTSKKLEGCMDLGTAHEMKYEPAKDAIMKNCN